MHLDLSKARWRKSVHSGAAQNCVEVADNQPAIVGVRDSKDREGPALVFGRHEWNAFITNVKTDKLA